LFADCYGLIIINKKSKFAKMSETAEQVELRKAQAVFIQQMNDYLVNGPLKLG
jgi:hypothetical protein